MDHGVGIEVGGSRSSVLSGRTQIFAYPPRISITSTPAQDPSKWLRGRGRCARPEPNFLKTTSSTGTEIVSETKLGLSFMSSVPPGCSPLRLPRGEFVFYPTDRPNIRVLTREIAALGYCVAVYPLQQPDLSRFPPGVWHWAVVLGDFILVLVLPSESAESSSDQSGYQSKDSPFYDSDNVDPENPGGGYGYWHSR
jgi:hypothetical protein